MGSATGLKIDAFDFHQPDLPRPRRRLDRHGADKIGVASSSASSIQRYAHGMVALDQPVQRRRQLVLVQAGRRHVEVQPAPVRPDLAAGDGAGHHGAQQMKAGMHPHMGKPALPVDFDLDGRADSRKRRPRFRHMDHAVRPVTLDGVDQSDFRTVMTQNARIARLPAPVG